MASTPQEDSGVVYVNEAGALRCISGRDGNACRLPPPKRLKHSNECTNSDQCNEKSFVTSPEKHFNKECQQPKSLLCFAMDFVIHHLTLVDSFIGFPSQIGKQLFDLAELHDKFKDTHLQCRAMKLFCDAYEQEVLESLNLNNQYFALNQCVDQLLLFIHVAKLDLSNCELGSDHDMVMNISNMSCLRCLNLSQNCLTNSGIQRLTTRPRMFHTGPVNLRYLSLSGNPQLSDHVVGFLLVFKKLEFLDISGTRISVDVGIANLERETDLRYLRCDQAVEVEEMKTLTCGWAASVVSDWIQCSLNKQRKPQTAGNAFAKYKRSKISDELKKFMPQRQTTVIKTTMQLASRDLQEKLGIYSAEDDIVIRTVGQERHCKKTKCNSSLRGTSCTNGTSSSHEKTNKGEKSCPINTFQSFNDEEMKLLQSYT